MFTQDKGQNKEMLRWLATERVYLQQTLTNGYILNSAATKIYGNKIWVYTTSLIYFKDTADFLWWQWHSVQNQKRKMLRRKNFKNTYLNDKALWRDALGVWAICFCNLLETSGPAQFWSYVYCFHRWFGTFRFMIWWI